MRLNWRLASLTHPFWGSMTVKWDTICHISRGKNTYHKSKMPFSLFYYICIHNWSLYNSLILFGNGRQVEMQVLFNYYCALLQLRYLSNLAPTWTLGYLNPCFWTPCSWHQFGPLASFSMVPSMSGYKVKLKSSTKEIRLSIFQFWDRMSQSNFSCLWGQSF